MTEGIVAGTKRPFDSLDQPEISTEVLRDAKGHISRNSTTPSGSHFEVNGGV